MIALIDGELAGVASLCTKDTIDYIPGSTPWICNVFVASQFRGEGSASLMCRTLEDVAIELGFKEIVEISKPRIVVLLVITAVTSMYAASKLVDGVPDLDYWFYLHIIVAGALASAGSSALNHYYDKDIDPKMTRTSTRPIPSGRMAE